MAVPRRIRMLILTKDHEYFLDGVKIDGLTSTLKEAGLIDTRFYSKESAEKGTDIHRATELYDYDNESNFDLDIFPYVWSWASFKTHTGYEPTEIEKIIHHPTLVVGMTLDRLPGPVEIKSGSYAPWHVLQLAAQWDAARLLDYNVSKPMLVYLDKNGKDPKVKLFSQIEMIQSFQEYKNLLFKLRKERTI